MDKRLQTLVLLATFGAGVGSGALITNVADNDLNLSDNDALVIYKGDTLVVHALSVRRPVPGGSVTLSAYSSVQTNDGGVSDLGEVRCGLDAGEQTKLRTVMNSGAVEKCAQGDSGVALASLFVHALDIRRRAVPFEVHGTDVGPDGGPIDVIVDAGNDIVYTMEAWATRTFPDGGTLDLGKGFTCAVPDAGQAQFDLIALTCVRRAKGLGK